MITRGLITDFLISAVLLYVAMFFIPYASITILGALLAAALLTAGNIFVRPMLNNMFGSVNTGAFVGVSFIINTILILATAMLLDSFVLGRGMISSIIMAGVVGFAISFLEGVTENLLGRKSSLKELEGK